MRLLSAILLTIVASVAYAQPLTLVVGFSPGGSSDLFTRLVAQKLSDNTGRKVVVQNIPGAGGVIAHTKVATGPSDGSVILLASVGPLTVSPNVIDVSYDPLQDFAPISMGAELPNILVVPKSLGVNNLKEFIALAKKKGNLSYGSSGIYSSTHMAGEALKKKAKIELIHIPYKGGSMALIDVTAGRISSAMISPFTAEPFIRRGELVAIAVTSRERLLMLPNVPTVAEQGFVGFDATNWYAFVAHKDVKEDIVKQLNKDIGAVLKNPEIQEKLIMHGLTVKYSSRSWLKQYITQELIAAKQILN